MDHLSVALMVQILDALVAQTVEQLVDILKLVDTQTPVVQVTDVPKISHDRIQQRLVDRDLCHPQMVEQFVEVPTVLSLSLLQQRIAEQIVDIPVPGGDLQDFLPDPGVTDPSAVSRDEAFKVFFSHFSPGQKSAEVAGSSSARVHGHSSSSTPAVYGQGTLVDDGDAFEGLFQDDAGFVRSWVRRRGVVSWWNLHTQHTQWHPPWER